MPAKAKTCERTIEKTPPNFFATKLSEVGSINEVPDIASIIGAYGISGIHPACAQVPDISLADFQALTASIASIGLLEPIRLDDKKRLVDGRCRLRACHLIGVPPRFETLSTGANSWAIASSNITRRHLTAGQRASIADRFREMFDLAAKQRQRKRAKTKPNKGLENSQTMPADLEATGNARDQAEKIAGVSGKSVDDFRLVKSADAGLAQKVAAGEISLNTAKRKIKSALTTDNAHRERKGNKPFSAALARVMHDAASVCGPVNAAMSIVYEDAYLAVVRAPGIEPSAVIVGKAGHWRTHISNEVNSRFVLHATTREKAIAKAQKILDAAGKGKRWARNRKPHRSKIRDQA